MRKTVRNARRRYVLYYLDARGGTASLGELVDRITAWENNVPVDEITPEQRKSVYSSLHQTHLPKLEQIGLVDYDVDEKTVSETELMNRISVYCAANFEPSDRWPKVFIGFATVTGCLLSLVRAGPIPVDYLFSFGLLAVGLLLALSLWQYYDTHSWVRRFRRRGPDYVIEVEAD